MIGRTAVIALAALVLLAGLGTGLVAVGGGSGEPTPIVELRRADEIGLDGIGDDRDGGDATGDGTSDSPAITSGCAPAMARFPTARPRER